MSDKRENTTVDEDKVCFCSGAMPHYDLKAEAGNKPDASLQEECILERGADCLKRRTINLQDVIQQLEENQ